MNDHLQQLIDGYLDGLLSPEESQRLNGLLKENPAFARRVALAMLLHDRLHAELQAPPAIGETPIALGADRPPSLAPAKSPAPKKWKASGLAAIAALALVTFIFWQVGSLMPASAASGALDRMIEAASQAVDRVYRIRVTDLGPGGGEPPVFSGGGGRKPGIDGAELYVRGSDKFVLVRHFGNGTTFVTGSDGTLGWAVAPKGAVHVSRDTRRFRRGMPGEHEEIPFLDLSAGFHALRRDYLLTLTPTDPTDRESKDWSRLDAVKQSARRGGPDRVSVWFDAAGVAHRIELIGMPQDRGGPRGVALELIEQRDLGPEFFKHEAHHDADRRVDSE